MELYKIRWKASAAKELKRLDRQIVPKIMQAVEHLSKNPYPVGAKKLSGSQYTYRIRIGDYRVIYTVISSELIVEVVRVGDRKEVYR